MIRFSALLAMLLFLGTLLGTAHADAPDAACTDICAPAAMQDAASSPCPGDDGCADHAAHCLAHCVAVLQPAIATDRPDYSPVTAFPVPHANLDEAPPARLLRPPIPA